MTARPVGSPLFQSASPEYLATRPAARTEAATAGTGLMSQRQFHLALLPSAGPTGRAARCFIEARYRACFGSEASVRYPSLLVLHDGLGRVAAAVGIRRASDGQLFLEHYLDTSVEQAIAAATGDRPSRSDLVELGSLAARSSLTATYLIAAMAAYMKQQGFLHALVTSTGRLRRLFSHFDFDLTCLGEAHKDALPDGGESWGHYYDDAPRVLAGSVAQCFAAVLKDRDRQHHAARRRVIDDLILQAGALA